MREGLIGQLLLHLQGSQDWKLGPCSKTVASTIDALGLPLEISDLLCSRWVNQRRVYAGKYLLHAASEIASDPWLLVLRTHDMVPIGSAANGDLLVLRFVMHRTIEIGVVNQALFRFRPHTFRVAHGYARITASLDEFLLRLADGLFVPADFESARQWTELQQEKAAYRALAS